MFSIKSLFSLQVYLLFSILNLIDQCGRGAAVLLFKVANDALKNKQDLLNR